MDSQTMRPSMAKNEQIRKWLNTGDLVLFQGDSLVSKVIRRVTNSPWSHVGMIMRLPEYDYLALYESTGVGAFADLVSGKIQKGVQLVPLSDRIRNYEGNVAIRQLKGILLDAKDRKALVDLRRELRGRPYERSALDLLNAAHDYEGEKMKEDLSSLFCSELVAECYQRLGLLSEEKASDEYTPSDFGQADNAHKELKLLRGHLGPEQFLTCGKEK